MSCWLNHRAQGIGSLRQPGSISPPEIPLPWESRGSKAELRGYDASPRIHRIQTDGARIWQLNSQRQN